MNYNDALRYIGSRLRFGIKPGLERTRGLLCRLGDPQKELRFVHVAGTNGKGSVCAMTAAGLIAAGYKTGLYTSPYITDFRERMQINGDMIEKSELARLTATVSRLIGDDEQITEFEVITCVALEWFREQRCDYVVLETGLGGRLDATNCIPAPLCAAITRIDLDHTAVLGDTIVKIASEKAGIIKSGGRVVISPCQPEEALEVLRVRCLERGIVPVVPDIGEAEITGYSLEGTRMKYGGLSLSIPLLGRHQAANAITAVEVLRAVGIGDGFIAKGISAAFIPARMELLCADPIVILDGAHNPNGAAALSQAVAELLPGGRIAVMGALKDKDYSRELSLLAPLFRKVFCADGFSERCERAEKLAAAAGAYTSAESCDSPEQGVGAALLLAKDSGMPLVVFGSLYLAGRVREYLAELLKAR